MKLVICCECNTEFGMANNIYDIAKERREKFTFFCPNGHPQVFTTGETEIDKIRRERDSLKQQIAYEQDRLAAERRSRELAERRASAAKGQITKMKKRASAGICPCCNRHFTDLQRHMGTQHPNFVGDPDAADHVH